MANMTKPLAFVIASGAVINTILMCVAIWVEKKGQLSPLWPKGGITKAIGQSISGTSSSSVDKLKTSAVIGIQICLCLGILFQLVAALFSVLYGRGKIGNALWFKVMFGISGVFLCIGLVVIYALNKAATDSQSLGIGWSSVGLSFILATADNIKKVLSEIKKRVSKAAEGAQGA